MSELFLENLNPEQRAAVLHVEGPLLILAGAGSGKTTVLVNRTGRLIAVNGVHSTRICVLTFTNKAATELKHRVAARLGARGKGLWAGTFHSFGLQLLRKYYKEAGLPQKFGILDAGDARSLVKELLRDFNLSGKTDFDAEKLLSLMSGWRERGQKHATTDFDYDICTEWLLPKYMRKLRLLGVADFDDLIAKPLELIEQHETIRDDLQGAFDYLMVDEFQDTNAMQMRLIQALVESHRNIVVVGDDDQAIYGWRGACVSHILDFPHLYKGCRVVRLERNYRSTPAILEVANSVIQQNTTRHGKILRSEKQDGDAILPEGFVFETEEDEADGIAADILNLNREGYAYKDIAVLYRSNSQGALLEASLRINNIPYSLSGGTAFFDRRETKDLLAYLRCALRPHEVAYRRIINTPLRGIGETSLDKIATLATEQGLSFHDAAVRWRELKIQPAIGERIDEFHRVLEGLIDKLLKVPVGQTIGDRFLEIATEMGYREYVFAQHRDPKAGEKRWMVIEIFSRVLTSFANQGGLNPKMIREFVDAMELRDVIDQNDDQSVSEVQLMTLHACKGLEFPAVYMIGLEEDLIPHKLLGTDISEERRLFYVGLTRAQRRLILSRARQRRRYGRLAPSSPSRFLLEIPAPMIQQYEAGLRPCTEVNRKSMLEDLFRKLDSNREPV
jgi:DNA helicase-2/ATP-dependent DNA helicase PcrA